MIMSMTYKRTLQTSVHKKDNSFMSIGTSSGDFVHVQVSRLRKTRDRRILKDVYV